MPKLGGDHRSPAARARDGRRREEIRSLYLELGDVEKVAEMVGTDRRTVLRHTRDIRPESKNHVRYSQETWDAIEAFLREEKAPYAAASQIFGPTAKIIRQRFPDLGWTREEAGRHQGEINALMWKLGRAVYANTGN